MSYATTQQKVNQLIIHFKQAQQRLKSCNFHNYDAPAQYTKNMDLIKASKEQISNAIEYYFADIKNNYIYLENQMPTIQSRDNIILQINKLQQELDQFKQKAHTGLFTEQDKNMYQIKDYPQTKTSLIQISKELEKNAQLNNGSYNENQDVKLKINSQIQEAIQSLLNQFTSLLWSADCKINSLNNPDISDSFYLENNHPFLLDLNEVSQTLVVYDLINQNFQTVKIVPSTILPHYSSQVVSPDSQLYISGGCDQKGVLYSQFCKINVNGRIDVLPNLQVKRIAHSMVFISNPQPQIFVVGGKTDNNISTKLCEVYDITTNKWSYLPKLIEARSRPSLTFHKKSNSVYAIFGTNSSQTHVASIEKLTIGQKEWQKINLFNFHNGFDLTFSSAVAINDSQILILGGLRDSQYFKGECHFNRNQLCFNVINNSINIFEKALPCDFLSNSNLVTYNKNVYGVGHFMQEIGFKKSLNLEGTVIIKIDEEKVVLHDYLPN